MDPAVHLACRGLLVVLFATAAADKLRDRNRFREIVDGYAIVPRPLLPLVVVTLPAMELLLAATLLWPATAGAAAAGALILLAGYTAAIAINLVRGRVEIDCGCTATPTRLGPELLIRNAVLVAIAAVTMTTPAPRALLWLDAVTVVGTVSCGLLFFHAASILADLGHRPRAVAGRIR